jgi:hypothetical protein
METNFCSRSEFVPIRVIRWQKNRADEGNPWTRCREKVEHRWKTARSVPREVMEL